MGVGGVREYSKGFSHVLTIGPTHDSKIPVGLEFTMKMRNEYHLRNPLICDTESKE